MPVDSQIPLQVQQFKPISPMDVLSLKDLATRSQMGQLNLENAQSAQQSRNALKTVLQDPANIDPQTGRLNPVGIAKVTQVDPNSGFQFAKQDRELRLQDIQFNEKRNSVVKQVGTAYVSAYDQYLQQTGGNKEEAMRLAKQSAMASLDEMEKSGSLSAIGLDSKAIAGLRNMPDPEQARAMVISLGGRLDKPQPVSDVGKVEADYKAGRISKEQRDAAIAKKNSPTATMVNMNLSPDADSRRFMAEQYLAGDKSVITGMGRSPKALIELRQEITKVAKEQGLTPQHTAVKIAEFEGLKAAERTAGTREAQLGFASHELDRFLPLAENASAAVPRVAFKPINQLIQLGESQWSPQQAALVAANRSVINAFAMVASRGVATVHNTEEAEKMLNTAASHDVYKATLKQLKLEVEAAMQAPKDVRKDLKESVTGPEKGAPGESQKRRSTDKPGWKIERVGG